MRPRRRHVFATVGVVALAGFLSACAAARIENVQTAARAASLPRPSRVVVFDFDTGASDVTVGTSPRRSVRNAVGLYVTEPDTLAQAVADSLASQLVDALRASGFVAERAAKSAPPGRTTWSSRANSSRSTAARRRSAS